ncbi:hypothetical protein M406DRAFT_332617 [Cryphonectria parasitica EP155]|uniref:Uncharacterized protein n=1 Tax=Cryphonectria parasitica (strain ATCC 38755 / EP155) TaxID=660469 RepID=A0A9P4XVU8_CRYP1|nr:uncharacterized protein M406DRAFT_332617 [Cryphonectria parasitica EP155]KAF3762232.1 hypothetical protein M406DRAFT_332617 [Cryphonectria parasitica EP155]
MGPFGLSELSTLDSGWSLATAWLLDACLGSLRTRKARRYLAGQCRLRAKRVEEIDRNWLLFLQTGVVVVVRPARKDKTPNGKKSQKKPTSTKTGQTQNARQCLAGTDGALSPSCPHEHVGKVRHVDASSDVDEHEVEKMQGRDLFPMGPGVGRMKQREPMTKVEVGTGSGMNSKNKM